MARYEVAVENDAGYAFLYKHCPVHWSSFTKSIVQKLDGEIVAAIVFQDANAYNVMMHVAANTSKRWITRDLIYYTFAYPFLQMKVNRVTGWVSSKNETAVRFDEKLGFQREATLRGAGEHGEDVYLYTMFKEDCKWLNTITPRQC